MRTFVAGAVMVAAVLSSLSVSADTALPKRLYWQEALPAVEGLDVFKKIGASSWDVRPEAAPKDTEPPDQSVLRKGLELRSRRGERLRERQWF